MTNETEKPLVPKRTWLALIVGIFAATCLPAFIDSEEVQKSTFPQLIQQVDLDRRTGTQNERTSANHFTPGAAPAAIL